MPEQLSITHVTTFFPPHTFGGDGVQVRRLAAAQARRGHDVRVVYAPAAFAALGGKPQEESADESVPGLTVNQIDAGGRLEPLLVQMTGRPVLSRGQLQRALETQAGPANSVVHFHNVSLVAGMGGLAAGHGTKLYTPHEYWLVCPTHMLYRYETEPCVRRTCFRCSLRSGRPPQLWRSRKSRDRHLSNIDRMLFPSELSEAKHREHGVRVPGVVLPHFLPDEYVAAANAVGTRAEDAEPFFLYVGRLEPVKGVRDLLDAHARSGVDVPLWIAGEGTEGPGLRRDFAGHPGVRFLGQCTEAQLGRLYRDTLALILPSRGYEVFGLVVAEAFAHGAPAIVSAIGGAAGLVEGSDGGVVYGSQDELVAALLRFADGSLGREAHGARGLDFVRKHLTEADHMERYEALVAEVAAQ